MNSIALTTDEKKETKVFSLPLLKQSIKSNWVLWLCSSFAMIVLISVINVIVVKFSKAGTDINQAALTPYVQALMAKGLSLEGLFEALGLPTIFSIISDSGVDGGNSILITMYYTVVGFVLPMIYVIIVGNKLIASQVDKGSLAFTLSTPTKRSAVAFTQALFLIGSVFLMILINTAADIASTAIAGAEVDFANKILLNLGLFLTIFAISGIAYLSSCIFNLGKHSIGLSGGLSVIFYLCSILAIFGQDRFVEIGMGNETMGIFKYFSIITLFDTEAIGSLGSSNVNMAFIWEFTVLFAIGLICYFIGGKIFNKKDLPL